MITKPWIVGWGMALWFAFLPAQGRATFIELNENLGTYYGAAYKRGALPTTYPHSQPYMINCYGVSTTPPDSGCYWTVPATGVVGGPWSLHAWVNSPWSMPMPDDSWSVMEIIFRTKDGKEVRYENRVYDDYVRQEVWHEQIVSGVEPANAVDVTFHVKLQRNEIANNGGLLYDTVHAFSPIPEPWVTGLLAAGVIGVGTLFERHRRRGDQRPGTKKL